MLDYLYASLPAIWAGIVLFVWVGFFILAGIDMGVCVLYKHITKKDIERRILLNTIAPIWESNQVWLILGVGALFAAFAKAYGTLFTSLYDVVIITLFATIIRAPGLKYRSKRNSTLWRKGWDCLLSYSSLIMLFGYASLFGAVLSGIPFSFNEDGILMHSFKFSMLLEPSMIFCKAIIVILCLIQGALFAAAKVENELSKKLNNVAFYLNLSFMAVWFISCFLLTHVGIDFWFTTFSSKCVFYFSIIPFILQFASASFIMVRKSKVALVLNSACIVTLSVIFSMIIFPYILPSKNLPHSLTVWNASASLHSLMILTISLLILFPIVLAYVAWLYKVFRGKVTKEGIEAEKNSY